MQQLRSRDIFGPEVSDFTVFPPQATAIQWMRYIESTITDDGKMCGGVLADGMGLGKTRDMSSLCEVNIVPATLIVAPLNTIIQTAREFLKTAKRLRIFELKDGYVSRLKLKMVDGKERVVSEKLDASRGQVFIPPGVLFANKEKFQNANYQAVINSFLWFRILIDEAHVLRNGTDTQFYSILMNIPGPEVEVNGRMVRFQSRFAITGTPIQNSKDDLSFLFKWIDNRSFTNPRLKDDDLMYYIMNNLFRRSKNNITPTMKEIMRFPKNEPLIHLCDVEPKVTEFSIRVSKMQLPAIKEAMKDIRFTNEVLTDERAYIIIRAAEIRSQNTSNDPILHLRSALSYPFNSVIIPGKYRGPNTKMNIIKDIVRSLDGQSIVIFHQFGPIKDAMAIELGSTFPEYKFKEINGKQTSMTIRDKVLMDCNDFIDAEQPVILFSSLKATSEGLNYQKFSKMVIVDQDPNPQQEYQAMTRIYRIGQEDDAVIWMMSMAPLIVGGDRVDIDGRLQDLKHEKEPLADIIDNRNAAWFFRRYYFKNQHGRMESGTCFDVDFENQKKGLSGGPDSVGPLEIY